MKKSVASTDLPDLSADFSATRLPAIQVEDIPGVEADAEVRIYLLFKDIAELYCTQPGDKIKTRPKSYLSTEDKWGPYHIALMPYAEDDEGYVAGDNSDETVINMDPSVYDGVRTMIGDLSLHGVGQIEFMSTDDTQIVSFRTTEDIVNTCGALLNQEDTPGSIYVKNVMKQRLQDIVTAIVREKATDGVGYPGMGYH